MFMYSANPGFTVPTIRNHIFSFLGQHVLHDPGSSSGKNIIAHNIILERRDGQLWTVRTLYGWGKTSQNVQREFHDNIGTRWAPIFLPAVGTKLFVEFNICSRNNKHKKKFIERV